VVFVDKAKKEGTLIGVLREDVFSLTSILSTLAAVVSVSLCPKFLFIFEGIFFFLRSMGIGCPPVNNGIGNRKLENEIV